MTQTRRPTAPLAARLAAAALGAALVAGCQGSKPKPSPTSLKGAEASPPTPIATMDGEPAAAVPVPAWAADTKVDLQSLLDRMAAETASAAASEPAPAPVNPPAPKPEPIAAAQAEPAPPAQEEPPALPVVEAAPKPFEQALDETTLKLQDLILQRAADGYSPALSPWKSYLGLAGLEVLRPGSFPQVITPEGMGGAGLSDRDYAAAAAIRGFLASAAALSSDAGPGSLADGVAGLIDTLDSRPMRIQAADLCTKVMGYGQYTSLPSRRFLQGKPIRAIVYTEVARFANKPVSAGRGLPEMNSPGAKGGFAVELAQTLELFHDADGLLTWRQPEQTVLETSRNKRRDFFLIQDVTLPATLSNGVYRLKITIRDRATGHEDQTVIPIEVVSDPALAFEPDRGEGR